LGLVWAHSTPLCWRHFSSIVDASSLFHHASNVPTFLPSLTSSLFGQAPKLLPSDPPSPSLLLLFFVPFAVRIYSHAQTHTLSTYICFGMLLPLLFLISIYRSAGPCSCFYWILFLLFSFSIRPSSFSFDEIAVCCFSIGCHSCFLLDHILLLRIVCDLLLVSNQRRMFVPFAAFAQLIGSTRHMGKTRKWRHNKVPTYLPTYHRRCSMALTQRKRDFSSETQFFVRFFIYQVFKLTKGFRGRAKNCFSIAIRF
jgi:hypothetical protein